MNVHPLGLGWLLWRSICFKHYGLVTSGPPFTRAAVEAVPPPRLAASREYYATIDRIKP